METSAAMQQSSQSELTTISVTCHQYLKTKSTFIAEQFIKLSVLNTLYFLKTVNEIQSREVSKCTDCNVRSGNIKYRKIKILYISFRIVSILEILLFLFVNIKGYNGSLGILIYLIYVVQNAITYLKIKCI